MSSLLKEARIEKGMTQEDVAEELGVSRTLVSQWEGGYVEIDEHALDELAKILDELSDWVGV